MFDKVLDESIIRIKVKPIFDPFRDSGGSELPHEDVPMIEIGVLTAVWVFFIGKNVL